MNQHTAHQRNTTSHDTARSEHSDDELMTLAEVAVLLRTPAATLRYWRSMHTGPDSFRVGRSVRYRRGVVMRWLGEQEANGRGPNAA